jgi:hypothetical protein
MPEREPDDYLKRIYEAELRKLEALEKMTTPGKHAQLR